MSEVKQLKERIKVLEQANEEIKQLLDEQAIIKKLAPTDFGNRFNFMYIYKDGSHSYTIVVPKDLTTERKEELLRDYCSKSIYGFKSKGLL